MSVADGETLRVAIDAQMPARGTLGGVEQFTIGLVHALGKLDDGSEEYLIVVHRSNRDWLNPYLGSNQWTVPGPPSKFEAAKRLLGPFRISAGKLWRFTQSLIRGLPEVTIPDSNGFYESLGVNVVHFPYQHFVKCNLPIVYNPHDLQHLHYPQFFTERELAARSVLYPAGCRSAHAVATLSSWVKGDIVRQYGIDPQKIYAIPFGVPTELYGVVTPGLLKKIVHKFRLPLSFSFYPAQTWEHKNHLRLLEALALLRDRNGLEIHLVCTGKQNDFWRIIKKRVYELRLQNQVHFLGFVDATELRALYHLAQFVIHPSLFEGGGLPILEGFREGAPVACSNVTSLPEYAGDAALYFDPTSVESIADALCRMTTDVDLRESLRQRGVARVRQFTWERTAKTYRALYRKVAGKKLSDEDRDLLKETT